ncbi:hypothetical protein NG796_15700 [Laspinema sp. A4]|nr:hypothetical protein [Laspinema sp. D2d]
MATFKPTSRVLRIPRSHAPTVIMWYFSSRTQVCKLQKLGHAWTRSP